MKWIQKSGEPESFREWKNFETPEWRPTWNGIPGTIKRELHAYLSKEQGWICCYCGKSVSDSDSHIEHIKPQSAYLDYALDSSNIFISCQRNPGSGEPLTCGNAKGHWYDEALFVSPVNPDCEHRFGFWGDGRIIVQNSQDAAAAETIARLNLDSPLLRAQRAQAIAAVVENIDALSGDEIVLLIKRFRQRNDDNRFNPFCFVIEHILESLK